MLGREKELQALGRFFDRFTAGAVVACIFEGEAGIGKTALWRAGVARARHMPLRVLSCAPAEAEATLSYSALADLLADVEPELFATLPAPQRHALEVALLRTGQGEASAGARAVGAAVTAVLAQLADAALLVVAIDDVQWLDRASARALEFAARRLGERPVGFLVSLRTPGAGSVPLALDRSLTDDRLERVRVGPLSAGALHQLIKARLSGTFNRAALLRIHRATGGNPLFALELASSLLRAGAPAAGEALPVPDDVRELIGDRLRVLPATTRELLLLASAMPSPTVDTLRRAIGISAQELSARCAGAEAASVIVAEGESVRFRHPLFSSAIYAAGTREERRGAHERLAALAVNTEERAWHLALCTEQPDDEVAATVLNAARDVRQRGAPEAAVELAELAIRLTPADEPDERDRRALELAYYLVEAGDAERARTVTVAVAERPGRLQARALLDLAALDYWGEGSRPAVERCEQALRAASGHPGLEAACHAELAVYCDFDAARCEQHAQAAIALLDEQGDAADPDALVDALLATARASLLLGHGLPEEPLRRAFEAESQAVQSIHRARVGAQLGQWLKYVDDFEGSRTRLEAAWAQAVQEGDESSLPNELMHLAQLELWAGSWSLASRYAEESAELAEQLGQAFGGPPAMRALVDAHLGRVERARAAVEPHLEAAARKPLAVPLRRVLGFLQLSLADAPGAVQHLSQAVEIAESFGIHEPAVYRLHADLIEALIGAGELDRAERALAEFEERARVSPIAWSLATGARSRGLLLAARGEVAGAEAAYELALRAHERLPVPFERARTQLALALLQRRGNRRALAAESLAAAVATFEDLGASLWAERARRELRPVGGRPTNREALTPVELRVAELAAGGMTNREVAAALFISPKTVEANLARAYRKLAIRSRAQLGAKLARERPEVM